MNIARRLPPQSIKVYVSSVPKRINPLTPIYTAELFATKTLAEAVEVSSTHVRKQFETLSTQTKELTTLAQKVATETAEPIKAGMTKAASQHVN